MSDANTWLVILADRIVKRAARKQRQREVRRQFDAARAAGLVRRYADKQHRMEAR